MIFPFPKGCPTVVPCSPSSSSSPGRGSAHLPAFPVAVFPGMPGTHLAGRRHWGAGGAAPAAAAAGSGRAWWQRGRGEQQEPGTAPSRRNEPWSIIKHPEQAARCSHLLIQILLREGGASLPPGNLGHGDLNLTVPLSRAWKGTQGQNIRIGPGGKNETQMGKTLPR